MELSNYKGRRNEIIAKAFYIARSGRPGPVLIDVTKDAQFASAGFPINLALTVDYTPVPQTTELICCRQPI